MRCRRPKHPAQRLAQHRHSVVSIVPCGAELEAVVVSSVLECRRHRLCAQAARSAGSEPEEDDTGQTAHLVGEGPAPVVVVEVLLAGLQEDLDRLARRVPNHPRHLMRAADVHERRDPTDGIAELVRPMPARAEGGRGARGRALDGAAGRVLADAVPDPHDARWNLWMNTAQIPAMIVLLTCSRPREGDRAAAGTRRSASRRNRTRRSAARPGATTRGVSAEPGFSRA